MLLKQLVLVGSKWESIPLNTNDSVQNGARVFFPASLW